MEKDSFTEFNLYQTNLKSCLHYLLRSHPEHPIATVATARFVRQGHRRVDVVLFGVRLSLADGIRRGQQLHGPGSDQGHERLLG